MGVKVSISVTCSILALTLSSFSSNASLVVSKEAYLAGNYIAGGVNATRYIASDLSVVDLANNIEFARFDVTMNRDCEFEQIAGSGFICNDDADAKTAISDVAISASEGWDLGTGYDLVTAMSSYDESYHWPGAYGAAPNYYSFYFDDKNELGSDTGAYRTDTLQNMMYDIFGLDTFSGSAIDILTLDPKNQGGYALMVGRESSPFGNFNMRWNHFEFKGNQSTNEPLNIAPLMVRQWDGESFLSESSISNAISVSEPYGTMVFSMGIFGLMAFRRRK